MAYRLLPWVFEQESQYLGLVEKRWRPTNLLWVSQARALLQDIARRYQYVAAARDEIVTLDRAAKYIQFLTRMRVNLRKAHFNWKADQLVFIRAISGFYSDYAGILRLIKEDVARGILTTEGV